MTFYPEKILYAHSTIKLFGHGSASSSATDGSKPNIIFLLADHSGFADFGCYGRPLCADAERRQTGRRWKRASSQRSSCRRASPAVRREPV